MVRFMWPLRKSLARFTTLDRSNPSYRLEFSIDDTAGSVIGADLSWYLRLLPCRCMDHLKQSSSSTCGTPRSAAVMRWSARILSTFILLFWSFFLIASLFGNDARSSHPLGRTDYLILVSIVSALLGLALAWKWEFIGAVITLFAVAVCTVVNFRVLYFPGTLIPFAALLYLLSWWARRALRGAAMQYSKR